MPEPLSPARPLQNVPGTKTIHVCVCTSYGAHLEPRGPRHAATIATIPGVTVTFVDALPSGRARVQIQMLQQIPEERWITVPIPHRKNGVLRLLWNRFCGKISSLTHPYFGVSNDVINSSLRGLTGLLTSLKADVYFAHNIDTLLPAWQAARRNRSALVFDSMEFHSDMGDSQSDLQRKVTSVIETKCLRDCSMIVASSPEVAEALESRYSLREIIPLYNVPPLRKINSAKLPGFNLYWRNAVIGLGQRGLGDALDAMTQLPAEVRLHLQGQTAADGGKSVRKEIEARGLTERVVIHPPYLPDEAIDQAARFQVGLCLEHGGITNHELTVSNKLFDYHMAGLAVVCSNLPGLSRVVNSSQGGLLFEPGNANDLARCIRQFYDNPQLLSEKAKNARAYAEQTANLDCELTKLREEFSTKVLSRLCETAR